MECELFEYSSERLSTGIPNIDTLQTQFDLNVVDWAIRTEGGNPILDESYNYICIDGSAVGQKDELDISATLEEESKEIVDFSMIDPFSEGYIGSQVSIEGLYILTKKQETIVVGDDDVIIFSS